MLGKILPGPFYILITTFLSLQAYITGGKFNLHGHSVAAFSLYFTFFPHFSTMFDPDYAIPFRNTVYASVGPGSVWVRPLRAPITSFSSFQSSHQIIHSAQVHISERDEPEYHIPHTPTDAMVGSTDNNVGLKVSDTESDSSTVTEGSGTSTDTVLNRPIATGKTNSTKSQVTH